MKIAIVTCVTLPEPDPDEPLLLDALRQAGHDAVMLPWDDPHPRNGADVLRELRGFDCAILRSPWNYPEDPAGFRAWIDRAEAATTVLNPPAVLRWNLHKGYLRALDARGVEIVPTWWIDKGSDADLEGLLADSGENNVVIKPAVSAGSMRTQHFGDVRAAMDEANAFAAKIAEDGDVMIQRYMPTVASADEPEVAIIWIGGACTHTIAKTLRMAGDDESVSEARPVSDEQQAFAERTLAAAEAILCKTGAIASLDDLLYARIDVMRDDRSGNLVLSELELLEPSLFFLQSPAALARFVAAVERFTP